MDIFTILSGICFAIGSVAIVIGAWGLITLKDVYSRIHAAGMIDTAGVGFFVLGMIFLSGWSLVTVKAGADRDFLDLHKPDFRARGCASCPCHRKCSTRP